jgi:DNA (cytosine-5)-methyltransferase 1
VFVLALRRDVPTAKELQSPGPNWLHNKAAAALGAALPQWIWWYAPQPPPRRSSLTELIDFSIPYDQDGVLRLLSPRHREKLHGVNDFVTTGYRRTRQKRQCLELRFDGAAGCLRTPQGGSSRQFLVVREGGQTRARLLSAREAARLMGVPDSYILPPADSDAYRAMGDAVAAPAVRFVGAALLMKLAAAAYGRG